MPKVEVIRVSFTRLFTKEYAAAHYPGSLTMGPQDNHHSPIEGMRGQTCLVLSVFFLFVDEGFTNQLEKIYILSVHYFDA